MSDEVRQRPRRTRARNGREGTRTAGEMRALARDRLIESRLTPNTISVTGLVGNLIAAVLILEHHFVLAGAAFILGSLCDMLDGRYSRMSGKGTPFGAFLDSTLDRLSDAALAIAAVYLGAAIFEIRSISDAASLPTGATASVLFWGGLALLVGSFLVSYIRAKAESLGEGASVGVAPREARIAIYLIGVAAWAVTGNPQLFAAAVAVAAFLATITVIQRIAHMATALDEKKG